MISQTHYDHFILSTDDGEHVVLDASAIELDRFPTLAGAMSFAKQQKFAPEADSEDSELPDAADDEPQDESELP